MTITEAPKLGRPRKYTDEERKQKQREWTRQHRAGVVTITIDRDLAALINQCCDRLAKDFGFRPTLAQALRHMLKLTFKE